MDFEKTVLHGEAKCMLLTLTMSGMSYDDNNSDIPSVKSQTVSDERT